MPINPTDYRMIRDAGFGPSIPEAYTSGIKLADMRRINDTQIQAQKLQQQRQGITQSAAGDFQQAAQQSRAIGDEEMAQKYDALAKEHDDYLLKRRIGELKTVANVFSQADTPEKWSYAKKFIVDNGLSRPDLIPDAPDPRFVEVAQKASEDLTQKAQKTDYDKRYEAYQRIQLMPESTKEEKAAKEKAMVDYFAVASPGTGYQASPMSIRQSALRSSATTGAQIQTQNETPTFQDEQSLRKEYVSESKGYIDTRDAYGRIQTAIQDPSAAGDVSLIYQYMKMLDPGSTVREGEAAMAQNAGGVDDKIRNMYNKVISGQRLTESQRQDFINQSRKIYEKKSASQKKLEDKYRRISGDWKVNSENVVGGIYVAPQQSTTAQSQKIGRFNVEVE